MTLSSQDLVELAELAEHLDDVRDRGRGRPLRADGWTVRELASAPAPPATRGECAAMPRPCPALRCRHHLPVAALVHGFSCDLDLVEAHPDGISLDEIGLVLGQSGESVRLTVISALMKVKRAREMEPWRK